VTPADDATGDFQEGFVDGGEALEAHAQSLEVVQPSNCSFYTPTGLAETTAMRLTATGDLGGDAGGVKRLAIFIVVVPAITLDDAGLGQWTAAFAADRRNRLDQRQQLGDVVAIGAGQYQRQRYALGLRQQVML
jgi:hypothetical protein